MRKKKKNKKGFVSIKRVVVKHNTEFVYEYWKNQKHGTESGLKHYMPPMKLKIKDITEEVRYAKENYDPQVEMWGDHIPYKEYKDQGYNAVKIEDKIFLFSKYGLEDAVKGRRYEVVGSLQSKSDALLKKKAMSSDVFGDIK